MKKIFYLNPDAILEYENAIQNYYLMRWKQEIEKNISSIKISDSELKKYIMKIQFTIPPKLMFQKYY